MKHSKRIVTSYILLFLVALLLRLLDAGLFVTHDEVEFWFQRSESLLNALEYGDFGLMEISTHPGVTTMWSGSIGIALRRWVFEHGLLQHETFPIILTFYRLPGIVIHSLGLLFGYAMLRRLLSGTTAFLAALLWATDPFIIAYSRLLHVDALMGLFATLSLLALCLFWHHSSRRIWLVLSAVFAALALLSKSPALALLPVVGLVALIPPCSTNSPWRDVACNVSPRYNVSLLRSRLLLLLLWGIVFIVTIVALFPALWANPMRVYEALRVGVEVEGASPHMTGNFFLGERNPAPGILFYPVALALRTTPWSLIGLLLLPFVLYPYRRHRKENNPPSLAHLRDMALFAGFIVLFVAAMSIFPKKFNRYIVPLFPLLDILAAVGLIGTIEWWYKDATRILKPRTNTDEHRCGDVACNVSTSSPTESLWMKSFGRTYAIVVGIALLALVNAVWWHPYEITAFNQLLGGAKAGVQTFAVGWGEGLEQVAAWINEQPDSQDVLTISHMITSLDPYLQKGARATFPKEGRLKKGAGYVVTYIYQVQGGPPPPPFDQFYPHRPPLHTVVLHGIPYAWVYHAPPPVSYQVDATFASTIELYGVQQDWTHREPGDTITMKLIWQTNKLVAQDYWIFAHLIAADGQKCVEINQPMTTSKWVPGYFTPKEMAFFIPASCQEGPYRLVIGLFDIASGQRLPLESTSVADESLAGPHALLLNISTQKNIKKFLIDNK